MIANEVQLTYKRKRGLKTKISSSRTADTILRPFFEDIMDHKESFKVILLSRSNQVLGVHHVSDGGISGTVVDIKIIAQAAILANASAVILSHNHPSGNKNPSNADKQITNKTKEALDLLDITVVDHLILTDETYYSFADEMEL
jgi:DNA repair protein RadC